MNEFFFLLTEYPKRNNTSKLIATIKKITNVRILKDSQRILKEYQKNTNRIPQMYTHIALHENNFFFFWILG